MRTGSTSIRSCFLPEKGLTPVQHGLPRPPLELPGAFLGRLLLHQQAGSVCAESAPVRQDWADYPPSIRFLIRPNWCCLTCRPPANDKGISATRGAEGVFVAKRDEIRALGILDVLILREIVVKSGFLLYSSFLPPLYDPLKPLHLSYRAIILTRSTLRSSHYFASVSSCASIFTHQLVKSCLTCPMSRRCQRDRSKQ